MGGATREGGRRRRSGRMILVGVITGIAVLAAACGPTPPPAPAPQRYRDPVFEATRTATDEVYARATELWRPNVVDLPLDVYEPSGDTLGARPAIVWVHGGGFKGGNKADPGIVSVATEYARRGYVTLSVGYRLDPFNRCQEVQDGLIADPAELAVETERCRAAIVAAQHDTQAAIRWLRANAARFRVDPDRIAVGGFSAGAITAVHVAQHSESPGDVGTNLDRDSSVRAALAASGCSYAVPLTVDAADAPVSLLASGYDPLVPFECVVRTADATEAAGVAVQRLYYPDDRLHARGLYEMYKQSTDDSWEQFLIDSMRL